MATDGSTWYAAGLTLEESRFGSTPNTRATIWRSSDGQRWSRVKSIQLGACPVACGIEQLAAGPGGVILTWVHPLDSARSTMYWSGDGEDWQALDKAAFEVPRLRGVHPAQAIVVEGRFVVAGAGCMRCGRVWSSSDGRVWTEDVALTTHPWRIDVASDGRRVVVVEHSFGDNETRTWTSPDSRTGWAMGSETLPIVNPRVTFAGNTFIAAGHSGEGIGIFTSPDGVAWTEYAADFEVRGCPISLVTSLEGSDDLVILTAAGKCDGIWVSRAPGGV